MGKRLDGTASSLGGSMGHNLFVFISSLHELMQSLKLYEWEGDRSEAVSNLLPRPIREIDRPLNLLPILLDGRPHRVEKVLQVLQGIIGDSRLP